MEKLYYDVLDNKVLKDKPKRIYEKHYLIDEDTFDNRFACGKDYLKNKILALIEKTRAAQNRYGMSFDIKLGYDRGYCSTMTYLNPNSSAHNSYSRIETPAIITSGRMRPLLQEIAKEIIEQDGQCLILERSYDHGYELTYHIVLLEKLISSTWAPFNSSTGVNIEGILTLIYPNSTKIAFHINRKELLSSGKKFFEKIKLDISSYVIAIKRSITDIRSALLAEEKKVETLKSRLANAEAEYAELEDYEKLLGEIYEGGK